jgi:hypothetical protein
MGIQTPLLLGWDVRNDKISLQRQTPQVEPAACGGSPRCADWRGEPAQGGGSPTPRSEATITIPIP